MKRRAFLKSGLVFTGLIWVPKLAAQDIGDPNGLAILKAAAAGGGGGCSTSQINFAGAATTALALDDGSASDYYLATQFVAGSAFEPCEVVAQISNAISGAGTAVAEIWSSSGSGTAPSAKLGNSSSSVAMNSFPASQGSVTFGGITGVGTLTNGSTYHCIIRVVSGGGGFSGNGKLYYQSAVSTSVAFAMSFKSGGAWTDVNGGADQARFKVQIKSA